MRNHVLPSTFVLPCVKFFNTCITYALFKTFLSIHKWYRFYTDLGSRYCAQWNTFSRDTDPFQYLENEKLFPCFISAQSKWIPFGNLISVITKIDVSKIANSSHFCTISIPGNDKRSQPGLLIYTLIIIYNETWCKINVVQRPIVLNHRSKHVSIKEMIFSPWWRTLRTMHIVLMSFYMEIKLFSNLKRKWVLFNWQFCVKHKNSCLEHFWMECFNF